MIPEKRPAVASSQARTVVARLLGELSEFQEKEAAVSCGPKSDVLWFLPHMEIVRGLTGQACCMYVG